MNASFVNPKTTYRAVAVLRERGEKWAEKILGRDLSRRSLLRPDLPWLFSGEPEMLVFADELEAF